MEGKPKIYSFSGECFQGELEFTKESLKINVSEFSKKRFLYSEIRSSMMEKDQKKFKFFKTLEGFSEQLKTNKKLKITESNTLIIPIEAKYKEKVSVQLIEIPLLLYSNENVVIQNCWHTIEVLSKKIKIQEKRQPKNIIFKYDQNSISFKFNGKNLSMLGNKSQNYVSTSSIPKNGVYYFQIKLIKSDNHKIMTGLKNKSSCNKTDTFQLLFGGSLNSVQYYQPQKQHLTNVLDGQIIKTVVDMNTKVISWFINGNFTHKGYLSKQLLEKQLFPFVTLFSQGDCVQFVNQ